MQLSLLACQELSSKLIRCANLLKEAVADLQSTIGMCVVDNVVCISTVNNSNKMC